MTDDAPASQRWRGRPVHSLLLQAFVFAIPVVASVAAALLVSAVGPTPETLASFIGWWVALTAIALVVLLVVDRLARKLLPLATLLKLSMVFPDRAPSRFRVARNAASVRKLSEQLATAQERGLDAEPVWAAETVLTLITALGHHDRRSRGHSERVHVYTELLADELDLPEHDRDRLRWAALLHDVGKLVIPSELLNKPAAPDDEEWTALRTHPQAGAELCAPLLPWLEEWGLAIAQHHEWYDGTGYPQGLKGTDISRAARIVAVADCYEVMTTSRTYKRALNPAAAREELARCAGTQFDPGIVRAFLNVSLGRLRLAMGPLAMLSTVPSMARFTSFLEPLARAGAVIGGAALIMGGGSFLPPDATAEPVQPPPAPARAEFAVGDAMRDRNPHLLPGAERMLAERPGTAPDRPGPEGDVAGRTYVETEREHQPPTTRRETDPNSGDADGGRTEVAVPKDEPGPGNPTAGTPAGPDQQGGGSHDDDDAASGSPNGPPPGRPPPRPAEATGHERGGGAHPTPPTSPPGQGDQKPPDTPVAQPQPPRDERAKGRDF